MGMDISDIWLEQAYAEFVDWRENTNYFSVLSQRPYMFNYLLNFFGMQQVMDVREPSFTPHIGAWGIDFADKRSLARYYDRVEQGYIKPLEKMGYKEWLDKQYYSRISYINMAEMDYQLGEHNFERLMFGELKDEIFRRKLKDAMRKDGWVVLQRNIKDWGVNRDNFFAFEERIFELPSTYQYEITHYPSLFHLLTAAMHNGIVCHYVNDNGRVRCFLQPKKYSMGHLIMPLTGNGTPFIAIRKEDITKFEMAYDKILAFRADLESQGLESVPLADADLFLEVERAVAQFEGMISLSGAYSELVIGQPVRENSRLVTTNIHQRGFKFELTNRDGKSYLIELEHLSNIDRFFFNSFDLLIYDKDDMDVRYKKPDMNFYNLTFRSIPQDGFLKFTYQKFQRGKDGPIMSGWMLDRETCNVNVIDGLDFGYLVDELGFAMPGMMQSRIEEVDLLECKTEVKLSDREKAELKTMFETMAARASKESVIRCMQDSKIKAKVASAYR